MQLIVSNIFYYFLQFRKYLLWKKKLIYFKGMLPS